MPTEAEMKETVRLQRLEDQAAAIAIATPNPGALAGVFATRKDIAVGKYSVRPFYDRDFELLQELGHPFAKAATGDTAIIADFVPRGELAWQLYWIMTRPLKEVVAKFKEVGAEGVKEMAAAEFGEYQLGALFALYMPVLTQITLCAESVIGYGAADTGEAKDAQGASTVPPP